MTELKTGTRIWIAAGFTDLRRGIQGLTSFVETVLEQAPFSGHVFVWLPTLLRSGSLPTSFGDANIFALYATGVLTNSPIRSRRLSP